MGRPPGLRDDGRPARPSNLLSPSLSRRRFGGAVAGGLIARGALTGALTGGLARIRPALADQVMGSDLAKMLKRTLPSVVSLIVHRPPEDSAKPETQADRVIRLFGSGFIIDPSGLLVTNAHVVDKAMAVDVITSDDRRFHGTVVWIATLTDLALVKINSPTPFPALAFGDSEKLMVGDTVVAVGNPEGLGTSASSGIVSALNRNAGHTPFDNLIQTDAAINPGNSGGPLLNLDGQVIGVDTVIYTGAGGGSIGLGFAIPSESVAFVTTNYLRVGDVVIGWIAAQLDSLEPDIALSFGLPATQVGQIVSAVDEGGAAARAGLRPSDIVLSVGGEVATDTRDLLRIIARNPVNAIVEFEIWRDKARITVPVRIDPLRVGGAPPRLPKQNLWLGISYAELTDDARKQFKIPDSVKGVLVTKVDPGSFAAMAGAKANEVVMQVDTTPVSSLAEIKKAVDAANADGRKYISVLVWQSGKPVWHGVPIRYALEN